MRTDDGSIVQECLNGDSGAFGILVDKYKAGIYAYVYDKLRNFQDAQDVTQEVFLQAYRNLRTLRRWESFGFWLFRIARNQCGKWARAQSRRPDREFIEDKDPGVLEAPSMESYRENLVDESLQEALDSLPETYREVLMLHYFGHSASVLDGKIYIMGGGDNEVARRFAAGEITLEELSELFASVDVYDPKTDTWTTAASSPAAAEHAAAVVDGRIYTIGGWYGSSSGPVEFTVVSIVDEYDPGLPDSLSTVSPAGKLLETWGQVKKVQ